MSEPIDTPLAKNCTLAMVPSASVAEADTVVAPLAKSEAPLAGEEMLTVGEVGLTAAMVMLTLAEVAWLSKESVTSALRAKLPTAVGVHTAL